METRRVKDSKEAFYCSKSEEYKTYTLVILIVISIACLLLNGWDRVVDPIHGQQALSLRLLMLPAFVIYFVSYKLKKGYTALSLASFLSLIYLVTIYMAIVSTFDNGSAHSLEGFVVAYICFLAIINGSPFKYILPYNVALLFYPVVLDVLFFHTVVNYALYFITMPVIIGLGVVISYTSEKSAYEKYRLSEKLKEQSYIDNLTQCYNRNKFDDLFGKVTSSTLMGKISVILIDVDDFKKVNDTFGHKTGDVVLKKTAENIKAAIRNGDVVIRWGGEEFLVIFPNTGIEECKALAQRIVERCWLQVTPEIRVSVSAGYGELGKESIDELIVKVDNALYEAKRCGKNRACVII